MRFTSTAILSIALLSGCASNDLQRFGASTEWGEEIKTTDQTWILNYDSVYLTSRAKGEEKENYARVFAKASCNEYLTNNTIQALAEANYIQPLQCGNDRDELQGRVLTMEQEYVVWFFEEDKGITVSVYDDETEYDRRNFGFTGGDPELWQSQLILRTIYATKQKAEQEGRLAEWEAIMSSI